MGFPRKRDIACGLQTPKCTQRSASGIRGTAVGWTRFRAFEGPGMGSAQEASPPLPAPADRGLPRHVLLFSSLLGSPASPPA